jgi:Holliday junction resolvase RusA-like endonuclease
VTVLFFVPGVAQPQGSKTAYGVKGRAVVVDKNPKLLKPWRAEIARVAKAHAPSARLEGAVRVEATFVMPKPASVKRAHVSVKPDLDKLARALLDGITDAGNVWKDDAQVVGLVVNKVYALPGEDAGARVWITDLNWKREKEA